MLAALFSPLLAARQYIPLNIENLPLTTPLIMSWSNQNAYLWVFVILALYLSHLITTMLTIDFVSTSFSHMVSPPIFAAIAYGRLVLLHRDVPTATPLVYGNLVEAVVFTAVVLALTALLARLRMKRHMRRFADTVWGMSVRPHVDWSYFAQGLLRIKPFFYTPLRYRACPAGLLIEGWSYVMAIPLHEVKSIVESQEGDFTTSGFYAATSTHELLKIQIYENEVPIFISPRESYRFLQYVEKQRYGKAHVDPWKEQALRDTS